MDAPDQTQDEMTALIDGLDEGVRVAFYYETETGNLKKQELDYRRFSRATSTSNTTYTFYDEDGELSSYSIDYHVKRGEYVVMHASAYGKKPLGRLEGVERVPTLDSF